MSSCGDAHSLRKKVRSEKEIKNVVSKIKRPPSSQTRSYAFFRGYKSPSKTWVRGVLTYDLESFLIK